MINATWDILEVLFIIFIWVETSNKTLEEIDELIDGEMHSDAPVLIAVMHGDVEVKPDLLLRSDHEGKKVTAEPTIVTVPE